MFELKIALKYLIPRRKSPSSSILAILSACVISVVVALVLIFFSVTSSIEQKWLEKITALNAPLRITPTKQYFNSYYYQVDQIAHQSDYTPKSIKEKLEATQLDPFDPNIDSPLELLHLDKAQTKDGKLRDLLKELTSVLNQNQIDWHPYQITGGSMRLRLVREDPNIGRVQNFISFYPYFFSFQKENKHFKNMILAPDSKDITNLLQVCFLNAWNTKQEVPSFDKVATQSLIQNRLQRLFAAVHIHSIASKQYTQLSPECFPKSGTITAKVKQRGQITQIFLEPGDHAIQWKEHTVDIDGRIVTKKQIELILPPDYPLSVIQQPDQFKNVFDLHDLFFTTKWVYQGLSFENSLSFHDLEILKCTVQKGQDAIWLTENESLHEEKGLGWGILLPKTYKKKGACLGDLGYLGYQDLAATSIQEQRLATYVAGFYDPGLSPFAGRVVVLDEDLIAHIALNTTTYDYDRAASNGLMAWFEPLQNAMQVKKQLQRDLQQANLSEYFQIETYQDYEFVQPLLKQFQSDKALLSLITILILVVACTNIISFLILLVHTKKEEIGILSAMGASKQSISMIFGLCGVLISVLSVLIGTGIAVWILRHMDILLSVFGFLQTHAAFREDLFGLTGNINLNLYAFSWIAMLTPLIAILAGSIASIKAMRLKPSEILRS